MKAIFKKKFLAAIASIFIMVNTLTTSAYVPLEELPGISSGSTQTLGSYLSSIYKIGITLAGILAVLMIVIGGIQYVASGMSPSGKEEGKGKITNAVLGLLLALLSWLILNTIDPNLVSLKF